MKRSRCPFLLVFAGLFLLVSCVRPIEAPVVDFSWCPDGSEGRLDYWFASTSTTVSGHTIETYVWEFGDGAPPVESTSEVIHRFGDEGTYPVCLTVIDTRGASGTVTKEVFAELAVLVQPTWKLFLGWPVRIDGIVENRFSERLDVVVIRAKFYGVDDVRLTDGTVEITDLEPGEKAAFDVTAQEYSAQICYATVEIESFVAECAPNWGVVPLDAVDH